MFNKIQKIMARQFILLTIVLIFSGLAKAQVIDDSSVDKIQKGDYNFTEGRFVAYLADTVSPTFVREQFQQLNIAILEETIEPLLIAIVNTPSDESIKKLEAQENVVGIYRTILRSEREMLENKLTDPNLSALQKKEIRQILSMQSENYVIEFDYSIDVNKAKKLMGTFRDIAYKIVRNSFRTVTLQAEPGNEPLLMDKVEQLPFVESTAMIGTIKN